MKNSYFLPEGKYFTKPVPRDVKEQAVEKGQHYDHCQGYPWHGLISGAAWTQYHVTVNGDGKAARCTAG
jgi:hypothetical protein